MSIDPKGKSLLKLVGGSQSYLIYRMQACWGATVFRCPAGGQDRRLVHIVFMCLYIIWIHMLALFHHIRRCRLLLASPLSFDSEEQVCIKTCILISNMAYYVLLLAMPESRAS